MPSPTYRLGIRSRGLIPPPEVVRLDRRLSLVQTGDAVTLPLFLRLEERDLLAVPVGVRTAREDVITS